MTKGMQILKVQEVRKETFDTVSVALEIPDELKPEFNYKPGQYITLETIIEGEKVRRSYSLCSAPHEKEWRVAIKKVPGGRFSTFANEVLKAGDKIAVLKPMGNFTTVTSIDQVKHYVFFAAGSGITPIYSLMKAILYAEPQSRVTLFYGNKNSSNIIFKEGIEALKNKHLGKLSIHYFLSREKMDIDLFQGRIDASKCKALIQQIPSINNGDHYYICGPYEMIQAVRETLQDAGIEPKKIHFELFTAPGQASSDHAPSAKSALETLQVTMSRIHLQVDGVTHSFDLAQETENILDAAIRHGADLPYSCKGGVCCTCRARVTEGQVEMKVNYALDEEEVEDGFVLTCQSYPRSKEVSIDFDQ
jgi:ring-1,2-phenylacetyl-CoA epoxidase subunit PaaE